MTSRDILPSPGLSEYIYRYRLRHFRFDGGLIPSPKPFPPRTEQSLVFYPRGSERIEQPSGGSVVQSCRSLLSGQYTERVNRFINSTEFLMISVEFKPGALFRLTGMNLSKLSNQCIDAESVFSSQIAQVNNRLAEAGRYEDMVHLIESFLKSIAAHSTRPRIAADQVLNELVSTGDILTVDRLSKNAFLSPRQLERKLFERAGICPKTFLKLSRFNRSLQMRLSHPEMSWLSIALETGYTDYQHLVKAYKAYTFTTPNLFLSEEFRSPGRVLGLTR